MLLSTSSVDVPVWGMSLTGQVSPLVSRHAGFCSIPLLRPKATYLMASRNEIQALNLDMWESLSNCDQDLKEFLLDLTPSKDSRPALAALKQAWREADAQVQRTVKRSAEGLADDVIDDVIDVLAEGRTALPSGPVRRRTTRLGLKTSSLRSLCDARAMPTTSWTSFARCGQSSRA